MHSIFPPQVKKIIQLFIAIMYSIQLGRIRSVRWRTEIVKSERKMTYSDTHPVCDPADIVGRITLVRLGLLN